MKATFLDDDDHQDDDWQDDIYKHVNLDNFITPDLQDHIARQALGPIQDTIDKINENLAGSVRDTAAWVQNSATWDNLSPSTNIQNVISTQIPNMLDTFANSTATLGTTTQLDFANHFSPIDNAVESLRNLAGPVPGLANVPTRDLPGLMGMGDLSAQLSAQINHPDLFARIHEIVTDSYFPTSVTENLAKKLNVFKVSSWETAANLAASMPEVREAAREVAESHPEVAEELATKVTGKERVMTGELSNDQRLTMFKEAVNMLGQSAITSLTSGNAVTIVAQVTFSIIVFIIAIVQIEAGVRASRGQGELETEDGDD